MSHHIFRSFKEPNREGLSWNENWMGDDYGLINCWEIGRELAKTKPKLAEQALNGELPMLDWKGGVDSESKKQKYGTFYYLAQLQGLRGEDLDINLSQEYVLICSRTGVKVIYDGKIEGLNKGLL